MLGTVRARLHDQIISDQGRLQVWLWARLRALAFLIGTLMSLSSAWQRRSAQRANSKVLSRIGGYCLGQESNHADVVRTVKTSHGLVLTVEQAHADVRLP